PLAHRPGRPLPDGIPADHPFDPVGVHSLEIVPCLVVGPDMFKAEPVIIRQTVAGFRRAVLAMLGTARMVAGPDRRRGGARAVTLLRANPCHRDNMGAHGGD